MKKEYIQPELNMELIDKTVKTDGQNYGDDVIISSGEFDTFEDYEQEPIW